MENQIVIYKDESNALFEVVTDYTYALDTLDNYDPALGNQVVISYAAYNFSHTLNNTSQNPLVN